MTGRNVLAMGAFYDLVAMATGAKSPISLKIWLFLKVQGSAYTGMYSFLFPFWYLFSYLITIV